MAGISPESQGSHRCLRFLYRADIDVPVAVLLLCHRARAPPDPTLQRHSTSECGVGRATTARDLCGIWPIPLRDPGPRCEIRWHRHQFSEGDGSETEADEHPIALAKRNGGKMGRKLSPRDPGPCHRAGRTTFTPAHA